MKLQFKGHVYRPETINATSIKPQIQNVAKRLALIWSKHCSAQCRDTAVGMVALAL